MSNLAQQGIFIGANVGQNQIVALKLEKIICV
jgi:hypothetical protein